MYKLIYHILIDRFNPIASNNADITFKGGNIRGIIDKLDYIKSLGMTGIMLSPFYKNAVDSYHGYHITSYEEVDPHFGSWSDVKELISEVHRRDMIIVADFVANHCHKDNPLYADSKHKEWFSNKSFGGIDFLPMFNTDNIDVREYLTSVALRLCELGFDAIRLDHATGPTYGFWEYFHKKVKSRYPNVKIIGEVWGKLDFKPYNLPRFWFNRVRYSAQEARQLEYVGVLDGVLDFEYQRILCDAAKNGSILNEKVRNAIKKHFSHYPKDFELWIFLDNHDTNRFLYYCNSNHKLLDDALTYSRQLGRTFLQYYGTEKYLTNQISIFDGTPYADERVRQCLPWD